MKKRKLDINATIRRNPSQLYSTIDNEVVMLSVHKGEYLSLNDIGSHIWQKLESSVSVNELVDHLCEIYDIDEELCLKETMIFLEELMEKEIIQVTNV